MTRVRFTDFDEYAAAIGNVDVDVRLLRPHKRHWSLQREGLGSLQLQHADEGSGFLAKGQVNSSGWGLYCLKSGGPVPVNGRLIVPGAIAVLPPGAEFCFTGSGPVNWYSVFVPERILAAQVDTRRFGDCVQVIEVRRQASVRLMSLLGRCFRAPTASGAASTSALERAGLEDALLATTSGILAGGKTTGPVGADSHSRGRLVTRAIEIIRDDQHSPLTVNELASQLGVSERTLLYACQEQCDITAQMLLINLRLHEARRCFKSGAAGHLTVAAVAARHGFFDAGRFAQKYFQLFGEYPLAALRRRQ